jgi:4-hydroxyphenylpyruvate dioxygenase
MTIVEEATRAITEEADFLKLQDVDHVEFWVGNAYQAAHFWQSAFGFTPVAYAGLETGNRRSASHVLEQGKIRLVLTAAYHPDTEVAAHQMIHGDGVKVIAFRVEDVDQAFQATTSRGARAVQPPTETSDDFGRVRHASIQTYGDTIHKFVDRADYNGPFLPGFGPTRLTSAHASPAGLAHVDHMVGNVELGKMNHWVSWYHQVMGFRQLLHFDDKAISTEYSALMSKVMENGTGRIKFPINEPAEGKRKSQIEEFLEFYHGPGVQHRGVRFLRVPDTYYDLLPERVGEIREPLERIRELGILVDRDDEGYLLQVFTQALQDRPTFFVEIIQRRGSRGFGVGNFKALFEALELEQDARGNL